MGLELAAVSALEAILLVVCLVGVGFWIFVMVTMARRIREKHKTD
jgi:hypothetical protein